MRNIAPSANQGTALRHRHRHSQDVQRCVAQPMPMSKGATPSLLAAGVAGGAKRRRAAPPLPRRAHHMRGRLFVCLFVCLFARLLAQMRPHPAACRSSWSAALAAPRGTPHSTTEVSTPYGSAPPARSNAPFSLACRQVGPRFVATRCTPWPRGSLDGARPRSQQFAVILTNPRGWAGRGAIFAV